MTSPLVFLLAASLSCTAFASTWTVYNVSGGWKIAKGTGGVAVAEVTYSMGSVGWDFFEVTSSTEYPDDIQMFGAGYLEGYLTQAAIWAAFQNQVNGTSSGMSSAVESFILQQDSWVREQATTAASPYWIQVGLVLAQFDGIYAGYQAASQSNAFISYADFLLIQLQNEIGDIVRAVTNGPTTSSTTWHTLSPNGGLKAEGEEGEEAELAGWEQLAHLNRAEHCSVLIKPVAGKLTQSHVTWGSFNTMLRIYKHYNLPLHATGTAAVSVSFSSYPGYIASGDDFYITSAGLTVTETTNNIFNQSLYSQVTTNTVPFWIRIAVANRQSLTGSQWCDIFSAHNSGTYNNQYQVVDNKLVKDGMTQFLPNTLWILEQIPGLCYYQDMTPTLNNQGYWPSYNIPYFPIIWGLSGYAACAAADPAACSYSQCPRANIFRRDQASAVDLASFQTLMRYNQLQTDPLSLHDACNGISARCDLNPPWVDSAWKDGAVGGMDCKITQHDWTAERKALIIAGPTWDSQPPFAWTQQWRHVPAQGMPAVFAFPWTEVYPSGP